MGQRAFSVAQGSALLGSSSSFATTFKERNNAEKKHCIPVQYMRRVLKIYFENFKMLFVFLITRVYVGMDTRVQVPGRPEATDTGSCDI